MIKVNTSFTFTDGASGCSIACVLLNRNEAQLFLVTENATVAEVALQNNSKSFCIFNRLSSDDE